MMIVCITDPSYWLSNTIREQYNLYCFVDNASIAFIDYLGTKKISGTIPGEKCSSKGKMKTLRWVEDNKDSFMDICKKRKIRNCWQECVCANAMFHKSLYWKPVGGPFDPANCTAWREP